MNQQTECFENIGAYDAPYPPYSTDLASSDFHLFGLLKDFLRSQYFTNNGAEVHKPAYLPTM